MTTSLSPTTTGGPTTALTTTTTAVAPRPSVVVVLVAIVLVPFEPELTDPNSEEFSELAQLILIVYDTTFRARYNTYSRCVVRRFRLSTRVTRNDEVESDVDIEFVNTETSEEIPSSDEIVTNLRTDLENPDNNFTLSFDTNSLVITERNVTTTTAAPATAPIEALTLQRLTFRSAGEEFTTDLLDSSSPAFQSRATLIGTTFQPIYQGLFSSFRSVTVVSFSNGSIINNLDLSFASASVPSSTAIANVLINAAPDINAFNVDTSFIFVNGAQVSSGASHKTSIITASCLALLPWILSNQ
nr:uncharacterized protein LOC133606348 [Nerophis lumbriciformis]